MVDCYENDAGPNHCERFNVDATSRFEEATRIYERAFAKRDVARTEHRLVAKQLCVAFNLHPGESEQPHTNGDEADLGKKPRRDNRKRANERQNSVNGTHAVLVPYTGHWRPPIAW